MPPDVNSSALLTTIHEETRVTFALQAEGLHIRIADIL